MLAQLKIMDSWSEWCHQKADVKDHMTLLASNSWQIYQYAAFCKVILLSQGLASNTSVHF